MTDFSPLQREVLTAAFYDGGFRVHEGLILAVKTNVGFRGVEYVQAFRSLRASNYLKWCGHSVAGGELYEITPEGRAAFEASRASR